MEHESVFILDDDPVALELASEIIESDAKHEIVGKADSFGAAENIFKQGIIKPTVAILDNSCGGQELANIIKEHNNNTVIISYSTDKGLTWGDKNWYKGEGLGKLPQKLTELQH